MLGLRYPPSFLLPTGPESCSVAKKFNGPVVCSARGPRPRYPRVWKSRKKIGTISKSQKLVDCIKGLSNLKEEVYGTLDSFIAWELEFPLIVVKKALKTLEFQKEWKRIIQVIKWMLSKGQGKTMGTYFTLINALAEDGRLEEAEELFNKILSENLESLPRIFFTKMVSIYHKECMHDNMIEVFADMEELGIRPEMQVIDMIGEVFQERGMMDKYKKLKTKYPPPKWEYRYIKGKRARIRAKQLQEQNEKAIRNTELDNVSEILSTEDNGSHGVEYASPDISKLDNAGKVITRMEDDGQCDAKFASWDNSKMDDAFEVVASSAELELEGEGDRSLDNSKLEGA